MKTITITEEAYWALVKSGRQEERDAIVAWLRDAVQPMTHTCWAMAKKIEEGAHSASSD